MTVSVLIFNPHQLARNQMASLLRSEGYDVEEADTAKQALDAVKIKRFDLVICEEVNGKEVNGQTGLTILEEHYRISSVGGIRRILITSDTSDDTFTAARDLHALCLFKPIQEDTLSRVVRSLIH
jgi:DNA-binding NtrC family response regulator